MDDTPLLTLAMIVRDEADFIADCLASVEGVVDDIIVVDTGSQDATRSIAQAAGARVVDFAWCDDFAAARNAALPHVRSSHLLVLDADERLSSTARALIRGACMRGAADCWMLPVLNAEHLSTTVEEVAAGDHSKGAPTYIPRLFRFTPDLKWEGVIHENPTTWLNRPNRRTLALEAPIVHYGYAQELVDARNKMARNEHLLRARMDASPWDPDPRIYLAKQLRHEGREDDAWTLMDEAWTLVRAAEPADRFRATVAMLATDVLRWLIHKPVAAGLPYAEEVLEWGLAHPNVLFFAGLMFERAAGHDDASPWLTRAEDTYVRGLLWNEPPMFSVLPGMKEWLLPLRLGIVRCRTGRPKEGVEPLERAFAHNAQDLSVRTAFAEALSGAGQAARALGLLEPALNDQTADAWWIAAWSMHRVGDSVPAARLLLRAEKIGRTTETHRARAGQRLAQELQRVVRAT